MTPREPDRFEARARGLVARGDEEEIATAVAAALRAAESSALERAEKVCRAKAKRMRDYAAETLDKESIPKAEACADQAEDCGDAIRALASPVAAPAAEEGQAGDEWICAECGRGFSSKEAMLNHHANWHVPSPVHRCPKCGRQWSRPTRCGDCDVNSEQDATPSEPAAPEKEIANLLGRGHVRNPREGEPRDAETYSSPAPLLPRVLAAMEQDARAGNVSARRLESLAAELRAYIAERAAKASTSGDGSAET